MFDEEFFKGDKGKEVCILCDTPWPKIAARKKILARFKRFEWVFFEHSTTNIEVPNNYEIVRPSYGGSPPSYLHLK
jgi:hypothetical protein